MCYQLRHRFGRQAEPVAASWLLAKDSAQLAIFGDQRRIRSWMPVVGDGDIEHLFEHEVGALGDYGCRRPSRLEDARQVFYADIPEWLVSTQSVVDVTLHH